MAKHFLDKEGLVTLWGKVKDLVGKQTNLSKPKVLLSYKQLIGQTGDSFVAIANVAMDENHLLLIGLAHGMSQYIGTGQRTEGLSTLILPTSELLSAREGTRVNYDYSAATGKDKFFSATLYFSVPSSGNLKISVTYNSQPEDGNRVLYLTQVVQVPLYSY